MQGNGARSTRMDNGKMKVTACERSLGVRVGREMGSTGQGIDKDAQREQNSVLNELEQSMRRCGDERRWRHWRVARKTNVKMERVEQCPNGGERRRKERAGLEGTGLRCENTRPSTPWRRGPPQSRRGGPSRRRQQRTVAGGETSVSGLLAFSPKQPDWVGELTSSAPRM